MRAALPSLSRRGASHTHTAAQRQQHEYDGRRAGIDIAAGQERQGDDGGEDDRHGEAAQAEEGEASDRRRVAQARVLVRRIALGHCVKLLHEG